MSDARPYTLVLLGLMALGCGAVAPGAEAGEKLQVGLSAFPPFVMFTDQGPAGASIDAWDLIARKLGVESAFVEGKNVADSLEKLQAGLLDVAVGGISITEERERHVDFTHAQFHTGLDILVRKGHDRPLLNLVSSLFVKDKLPMLLALLLLVLLAGHVIWLAERSTAHQATTFSRTYVPGVFEGMYWALVTASTIGYGDKVPHRWSGRLVAAIVIILSLPLFGCFIAQLSSDLTLQRLQSNIHGPEDLPGKRVAVVHGSTSDAYVRQFGAFAVVYDQMDACYDALLTGTVDAVVADAPNLLYYVNNQGKGRLAVVGKLFAPQDYAFAVRQDSPLRKQINLALAALAETNEWRGIRAKWFGN
jgi:polar amino acid transport system substrate-binding protein